MKLKVLDLFSGIGGFSLGLEATNYFETVGFCEIDNYCKKILKKHWPQVPIYEDINNLNGEDIGKVDVITGGYPCQPFSVAGKQKAEKDPRHLWPEYFRLIKELQPTWIIGENVSGHIKLGLDSVLQDLESENYTSRTFSISASSVGAKHKRERIWIIGHKQKNSDYVSNTNSERQISTETPRDNEKDEQKSIEQFFRGCSSIFRREILQRNWSYEPDMDRVAHGVSRRMDRIKCLGNAVVPYIPFLIGECIGKINSETLQYE